jgi:hypothetical protein
MPTITRDGVVGWTMRHHVAGAGGQTDITDCGEIDTNVEVPRGVVVGVCVVAEGCLFGVEVELVRKGLAWRLGRLVLVLHAGARVLAPVIFLSLTAASR